MTHTEPTAPARHAIGSSVRITGDTDTNLGRIGEIVHDTGVWYRLRIDNGPAVLFRHEHVEAVTDAEALPVRHEIAAGRAEGLAQMLDWAVTEGEDAETVDGLRRELADAEAQRDALAAEIGATPTTGTPATISYYTDTRAAVVLRSTAKSVWIARVETRDERTENQAEVDAGGFPVRIADGVLHRPVGHEERFTLYTDRDGRTYATKGDKSIRVRFGRSVSRVDYRH